MSKSNDSVNLTQDQLEVSIPSAASKCFEQAYSGHRTLLEKMLEGIEITIKEHLGAIKRDWKILSHKSKNKLLTKIFEQLRAIMKVDDPSGLGPSMATFNSYRTKIARCMIYHVGLSDAHYNNRGLAEAMENALKLKGGTLKSRMKKALDVCKEDENWAGHPPKLSPVSPASVTTQITMPTPGTEDSPEHLVYLFLSAIVQGGSQASLREILRDSEDTRFQRAYKLYLEAKDMLDDFPQEEEAAAA